MIALSGTNCLWGPLLVLLSLRELVVAVPVLGDLGMSASSYVERTAEYSVCDTRRANTVILRNPPTSFALPVFGIRGGGSAEARGGRERTATQYGRISDDEFRLTPEQINSFHEKGCITLEGVLSHDEVDELLGVFERFVAGEIEVPGKDYCDMSKPFGIPYEEWSLVNCMLPTRYFPPLRNNVYERLTASIARQLFPHANMTKDYDQFLNKRPGKSDAVFAWHQDMAYWPGPQALNVSSTDTCTFSLAMDDSTPENGCLRYLRGSGITKTLRPHRPLAGDSREDAHALTIRDEDIIKDDEICLAPAPKGSITIHDEWVVHGSGGNHSPAQRRTYVVAYRAGEIVAAERRIGFTHSHNDDVNWDTFQDGAAHRSKSYPQTKGRT